jgi:hypothetical protein
MPATYSVNDKTFDSFFAAIDYAQTIRANVIEVATGLRRWAPAPIKPGRTRHVLVNPDGSTREFSRVKR